MTTPPCRPWAYLCGACGMHARFTVEQMTEHWRACVAPHAPFELPAKGDYR